VPIIADRANLLAESSIRWDTDNVVDIWRRFRALCGQRTGLRLRALIDGAPRFVEDLAILDDRQPAAPGTVVDTIAGDPEWSGCPVVCCNGGLVALRPGSPAPQTASFKEGYPATLMNRQLLQVRCRIPISL
jgi:hypothetical protein